jgi:ABC-2 type transport system ATP-binding protein
VLARGTEREIVRDAALTVWAVQGEALTPLVAPLKAAPGVLSVAAFGNALHVAGSDAAALDAAVAPWRNTPGLAWQRTDANLEDVFISLLADAPDNFKKVAA